MGLPLALAFKNHYRVVGYDADRTRVQELMKGMDRNDEVLLYGQGRTAVRRVGPDDLDNWFGNGRSGLVLGEGDADILPVLRSCNVFVIAVPTGVDKSNTPDKGPLMEASILAGSMLKTGDVVIYESTVYPGCTEEFCVPILEQVSGLKHNRDFFCGYSPERINPGDEVHRLQTIVKLTSGSTPLTADFVDELYRKIVPAGTFKTKDIKTAEASKVMENIQRDVNIAFMNEMTVLFHSLGLRMEDVLAAARTRWNFAPFTPGLVGGHCVGVDPYWLLWKAKEAGVPLGLVESARERNESMPRYLAERILNKMRDRGIRPQGADVLVFGESASGRVSDHPADFQGVEIYTAGRRCKKGGDLEVRSPPAVFFTVPCLLMSLLYQSTHATCLKSVPFFTPRRPKFFGTTTAFTSATP